MRWVDFANEVRKYTPARYAEDREHAVLSFVCLSGVFLNECRIFHYSGGIDPTDMEQSAVCLCIILALLVEHGVLSPKDDWEADVDISEMGFGAPAFLLDEAAMLNQYAANILELYDPYMRPGAFLGEVLSCIDRLLWHFALEDVLGRVLNPMIDQTGGEENHEQ